MVLPAGKFTTALLGCTLIAAAPLFIIGGPDWVSPPLVRVLWSLGHVLFFFLALALLLHYRPLPRWQQWLATSLAVLAISVVIEYGQSRVGRNADWQDVLRNLIGAWLALFWLQRASALVWVGRCLSLLLLALQLLPLVQVLSLDYRLARQFPVLSNLEHDWDAQRWSGTVERVRAPVSEGEYSLKITLLEGRQYPGTSLSRLVGDWRGYQWLSFDLFNPDDTDLTLTLRINDRAHDRGSNAYRDRYNTRLRLTPGWNSFQIDLSTLATAPQTRTMDLHQIQRLVFFAPRQEQSRVIYLDNMRLEGRDSAP